MPNIPLEMLRPTEWLHWTSILHYVMLLVVLYMLISSGDKTPLLYIIVLAGLALCIGADLYADKIAMPQFVVFLIRVIMIAVPILMAGWSPTETARSSGIVAAILAAPGLALVFFTCNLAANAATTPFADPRIVLLGWCSG